MTIVVLQFVFFAAVIVASGTFLSRYADEIGYYRSWPGFHRKRLERFFDDRDNTSRFGKYG